MSDQLKAAVARDVQRKMSESKRKKIWHYKTMKMRHIEMFGHVKSVLHKNHNLFISKITKKKPPSSSHRQTNALMHPWQNGPHTNCVTGANNTHFIRMHTLT